MQFYQAGGTNWLGLCVGQSPPDCRVGIHLCDIISPLFVLRSETFRIGNAFPTTNPVCLIQRSSVCTLLKLVEMSSWNPFSTGEAQKAKISAIEPNDESKDARDWCWCAADGSALSSDRELHSDFGVTPTGVVVVEAQVCYMKSVDSLTSAANTDIGRRWKPQAKALVFVWPIFVPGCQAADPAEPYCRLSGRLWLKRSACLCSFLQSCILENILV